MSESQTYAGLGAQRLLRTQTVGGHYDHQDLYSFACALAEMTGEMRRQRRIVRLIRADIRRHPEAYGVIPAAVHQTLDYLLMAGQGIDPGWWRKFHDEHCHNATQMAGDAGSPEGER